MKNIGAVILLVVLLTAAYVTEAQPAKKRDKKSDTAVTPSSQKDALLKFKKSLKDPRGILNPWTESTDPCKDVWPGIECSTALQIQSINLPNFGLEGKLPSFSELRDLRSIRLPNNTLLGPLPEDWRLLSTLHTVDLTGNQISGQLPESWSDLSSLFHLYLSGNHLTGSLPAAWWLGNFEVLSLAENHLEGTLPNNWVNMEHIRVLDLGNNHISGPLPQSWGGLSKLQVLRLDNNDLFGSLPEKWAEMESLLDLRLGLNYLVGALPSEWSKLSKVINLFLNENNLGGFVPESWSALSKTCRIDLSKNPYVCSLPPKGAVLAKDTGSGLVLKNTSSGKCPSPGSLDTQALLQFKADLVTETGGDVLTDWKWKHSSACKDQWTGIQCHDHRVTAIDLSNLGLSGYLSRHLSAISSLETLKLDGNAFNGILPESWGQLTMLKHLNLSGNTIGGLLPVEWDSMTELEVVDVSNNLLVGELPERWKTLKHLKIIRGFNNTFDGQLPFSWSTMERIKIIQLQNNILSGALPNTWRTFKQAEIIDLSANELIGPVPSSWKTMAKLRTLNLQGNDKLCGGVPSWYPSTSSQTRRILSTPCADYVTESILLVDFKSEIEDPRHSLDLWKAGSPPCLPLFETWPGITCNDGRVISIDLTEFKLEGKLPEVFSRLSMLKDLHLGGNKFSGDLPTAWSELFRLKHLNVSSNRLSGTLPIEWSTLVSLKSLDLSRNVLEGEMPHEWSSMTKLKHLDVSQNSELCGGLPSDLSDRVEVIAENSTFFESCDAGDDTSWAVPILSVLLAVFIFVSMLIWITCFCCCCYQRKKQRGKLLEMMSISMSKNRSDLSKDLPLSSIQEQPSASDVPSRNGRISRSPNRFPAAGDASHAFRAVHPCYPSTRMSWSCNEHRASSSRSCPQRPRSTPNDATVPRRSSGFGSIQSIPATTSLDASNHRGPQHPTLPGGKSGLVCRRSMQPSATPSELQSHVLKVRSTHQGLPLDPRKRASKIPRRPTPSASSSVLNGSSSCRSSEARSVSDRSTVFRGSTRASTPPSGYRVHFVPSESEELTAADETPHPLKPNTDWQYETTIQIPSNSSRGCPSPSHEMFRWLESCYHSGTFDNDDLPRELMGRAVQSARGNPGPSLPTLQQRQSVMQQTMMASPGMQSSTKELLLWLESRIEEAKSSQTATRRSRPVWGQEDSNGMPIFNYKTCSTVDDEDD